MNFILYIYLEASGAVILVGSSFHELVGFIFILTFETFKSQSRPTSVLFFDKLLVNGRHSPCNSIVPLIDSEVPRSTDYPLATNLPDGSNTTCNSFFEAVIVGRVDKYA